MIFESIELDNIFTYYSMNGRPVQIDLSGCTEERPIVLIRGHNGAGKTSLLNAVKLLFLGAGNENIRRIGYPPRVLGHRQYVVGQPGVWSGLINTRARREGVDRAHVRIVWTEAGRRVEATRSWKLQGAGYDETLILLEDGHPVDEDKVGFRLAEILPPDFVPFFFFDGEQIQALADAEEGRKAADIERVLRLSYLGELELELERFVKQRRRDVLPADVQAKIAEAEGRRAAAEAESQAAEIALRKLEEDLLAQDNKKRELDTERDRLRGGLTERERALMQQKIDNIGADRADRALSLAQRLPIEAPFLTNLDLVKQAFQRVEVHLSVCAAADTAVIEGLRQDLPNRIFDDPNLEPRIDPPLLDAQRHALHRRLDCILRDREANLTAERSPLPSLSSDRARSVRDRLVVWVQDGPSQRAEMAADLRHMRQSSIDYARALNDMKQADFITETARTRIEEIDNALAEISEQIKKLSESIGDRKRAISDRSLIISSAASDIRNFESEYEKARINDSEVNAASLALSVARQHRRTVRSMRRERVEEFINQRREDMLSRYSFIDRITVDDDFIMKYYTESGELIGRSSLSAGMKQLAALSFLWALKDVSTLEVPVVIDTPLGRIDQENQNTILTQYYPCIGGQVVLLPTSSEIDDHKLSILREHIHRVYMIENRGGDYTQCVDVTNRYLV